jgi:hypothetical protein
LFFEQRQKQIGGLSAAKYSGDETLLLREQQLERHVKALERRGISLNGKIIPLSEIGVTKRKRFCELYVMLKGMESLALDVGYEWLFVTVTAPARFHCNPEKGKSSWNYSSARDAHEFIKKRWEAWGRDMARNGLKMSQGAVFGIRVVEPHKDGCPHWHVLFFVAPGAKKMLVSLLEKHFSHSQRALHIEYGRKKDNSNADDGLNGEAASAATYICKYLMKTTGWFENVGGEDEGSSKQSELARVDAWRGATRIRAFQQFGGISGVTKWRILRKYRTLVKSGGGYRKVYQYPLPVRKEIASLIEKAAIAADSNDYKEYHRALTAAENLGGSILIVEEGHQNKYGEPVKKTVGIDFGEYHIYFLPVEVVQITSSKGGEDHFLPSRPEDDQASVGGVKYSCPRGSAFLRIPRPQQ